VYNSECKRAAAAQSGSYNPSGDILAYGFQNCSGTASSNNIRFDAYQSVYLSARAISLNRKSVYRTPFSPAGFWVLFSDPIRLPLRRRCIHTPAWIRSQRCAIPMVHFKSRICRRIPMLSQSYRRSEIDDTTISNITVLRMQGYNIGAIKLSKK